MLFLFILFVSFCFFIMVLYNILLYLSFLFSFLKMVLFQVIKLLIIVNLDNCFVKRL